MSVTIAMPRMSTDPELTTAQSKYVESLARAGAEVHWVELSDPDAAAAEALTCDGLLLPGGGDMDPAFYGQRSEERRVGKECRSRWSPYH